MKKRNRKNQNIKNKQWAKVEKKVRMRATMSNIPFQALKYKQEEVVHKAMADGFFGMICANELSLTQFVIMRMEEVRDQTVEFEMKRTIKKIEKAAEACGWGRKANSSKESNALFVKFIGKIKKQL